MKHWMFRCNDVSQKVSQSMDAALPIPQRMAVWMHLLMCRYCLRFRNQLKLLRELSRVATDAPADTTSRQILSDEARKRIKKRLSVTSLEY